MWLVQYVFSISVFSEYWCSTVTFSLLRDLDLGNLFNYLFYFYDSGDEYQATRESFPILYVIPSYTDKLHVRILRVHETGQCSFICLFILTPMKNYVRWEEFYIYIFKRGRGPSIPG